MTKEGLIVFTLVVYGVTIWITYEILKVSIKDALRELKSAEKAAAEKAAEAKVQD
jgi:hypothetical protein